MKTTVQTIAPEHIRNVQLISHYHGGYHRGSCGGKWHEVNVRLRNGPRLHLYMTRSMRRSRRLANHLSNILDAPQTITDLVGEFEADETFSTLRKHELLKIG